MQNVVAFAVLLWHDKWLPSTDPECSTLLNERWVGLVGWFLRTRLPPNQGKIPVRFEWKNGKNLRIIVAALVRTSLHHGSPGVPGSLSVSAL